MIGCERLMQTFRDSMSLNRQCRMHCLRIALFQPASRKFASANDLSTCVSELFAVQICAIFKYLISFFYFRVFRQPP
eukprot:6214494-Pleurochrysis_carterae.AAC.6